VHLGDQGSITNRTNLKLLWSSGRQPRDVVLSFPWRP